MALDDYAEALSYDIAFWLVGVRDPAYPIGDLGALSLEVGAKLRAMALITLLSGADPNPYCHNLIRSGAARETFLRRCVAEGRPDLRHYAAGKVDPVIDAVAAGDFALARRIGEAGPVAFRDGYEYEDDFCFSRLLSEFASGRPDPGLVQSLCARFEAYAGGAADARLDVCRAFASRDAEAFAEAFEERLDERKREIQADKARRQLEDPGVLANRRVFVEGLALLRLAELQGMPTEANYPMCPSVALAPMTLAFPGE
jgi:hypothetical protein